MPTCMYFHKALVIGRILLPKFLMLFLLVTYWILIICYKVGIFLGKMGLISRTVNDMSCVLTLNANMTTSQGTCVLLPSQAISMNRN